MLGSRRALRTLTMAAVAVGVAAPAAAQTVGFTVEHDRRMFSRVVLGTAPGVPLGDFGPSEYVVVGRRALQEFTLERQSRSAVSDAVGRGQRLELEGVAAALSLRKRLTVTTYDAFPGLVIMQASYLNQGTRPLGITRWVSRQRLPAGPAVRGVPAFWSYQSGSYEKRPDWVLPLRPGFSQENFLGMNASDYGGGTPVVAVWRRDLGLAMGHVEAEPRLLSLPVAMRDARSAELGLEEKVPRPLAPGATLTTPRIFLSVHRGDHFAPLAEYRRFMGKSGLVFAAPPESAYEPIWCGWGYGRDVTREQMTGTLAKASELGFGWAVLDDGWQTAEGDWKLHPKKFPGGESDMKALTAAMRASRLRPMLWWAPLAVDPGTDLIREHPEYLLHDPDGRPRKISWWNALYLCPAFAPAVAHQTALVTRFLGAWGFEGLKLDGQHLNAAPPCFNRAHGHARPEEAPEAMPGFWRQIAEAARKAEPRSVLELCPCGTAYAFHSLPHVAMPAASDPLSSWQIRSKGKTLKALMGPSAAYFGDHVELSDGGEDFASTVGVGGVVGTQFTLPALVGGNREARKHQLTPAREAHVRRWVELYRRKQLARGEYLGGLYDIGFDRPEAHAVRTKEGIHYAFFARRHKGAIELRGLEPRRYCVRDYVNDRSLGSVTGPRARLDVQFEKHLLVEAIAAPENGRCSAG